MGFWLRVCEASLGYRSFSHLPRSLEKKSRSDVTAVSLFLPTFSGDGLMVIGISHDFRSDWLDSGEAGATDADCEQRIGNAREGE